MKPEHSHAAALEPETQQVAALPSVRSGGCGLPSMRRPHDRISSITVRTADSIRVQVHLLHKGADGALEVALVLEQHALIELAIREAHLGELL